MKLYPDHNLKTKQILIYLVKQYKQRTNMLECFDKQSAESKFTCIYTVAGIYALFSSNKEEACRYFDSAG